MDSKLIFALVRAAELLEAEADSWGNAAGHPERAQAATIRALIERERNGGERAQIVAWLRTEQGKGSEGGVDYASGFADAIEAGAHLGPRVLSVNVVDEKREGE